MNQRVLNCYRQIAAQTGLALDAASGTIYGVRDGYELTILAPNAGYPLVLELRVSVSRQGTVLSNDEIRELKRSAKGVRRVTQNGNVIALSMGSALSMNRACANAVGAAAALTGFLRTHGFYNVCQMCARPGQAEACYVGGAVVHLCPSCYAQAQQGKAVEQANNANTRENPAAGAVGALMGSLVGVACIVLLSQLGYVAALSGLVMAVCALKGYEMLGGKLTKKGVAIASVLMLAMTYFGDRIDWAIIVVRELGTGFFESFRAVPLLLREGVIVGSTYWGNLALLYFFLLLGAVPTVLGTLRRRKAAGVVYHLGDTAAAEPPAQM